MRAASESTVRLRSSQAYPAASLAQIPTLALPPLSPDRAPKYRPSGSPAAGPTGSTSLCDDRTGGRWPRVGGGPAVRVGGPTGRESTFCTLSVVTRGGAETPHR